MFFEKHTFPQDFKKWIWQDNGNKVLIIFSLVTFIVMFEVFIRVYPFPNFMPDSYSYIDAAFQNENINMWPIGYSKFLRFVSVFNHTDKGLFFVQYFTLQGSILFFLLTIKYLFDLGKWIIGILAGILILNPLWLYVSNFVSSDAMFAAFSLFWMTTLIWVIYSPSRRIFLLHGLVLAFAFSIRYNALYYPFVTILVILFFSRHNVKQKAIYAALSLIPVAAFIGYTTYQYEIRTKTVQFSAFGGWQLASNAMYMYSHVSPKVKEPVPSNFKSIHAITVRHMDSIRHVNEKNKPDKELGIYYLWDEKAPLKQYLARKWQKDSTTPYLKRWASVAPLYSQYGSWLIKQFPIEYSKYYLWPNLINYYAPPTEFLGIYNMGADSVDAGAIMWFKYKNGKIKGYSKDKRIKVTNIYPVAFPIINIIFFAGFLGFLFIDGFKRISTNYKKTLILMLLIWFGNLTFSVMASPIVLRYQVFPFIMSLTFGIIFLAHFIKESFRLQEKETQLDVDRMVSVIP